MRKTKINKMIVGKAPEDWNVKPGDVVGEEEVILIDVPDGWTAHKEGIVICREDWHWCDQDMWWAQGPDGWWLDVGTYSPEHKKYVCLLLRQKPFCEHVHFDESDERGADEVFPDWQNPDERVELDTADEVVAWICGWFEKLSAKSA